MRFHDLLPALALCLLSTAVVAGSRFLPRGDGPVLVRLDASGIESLLSDPALAGIALVDTPARGFAVLRGDTALIRSALGLTIAWKGTIPCAPNV